MTPFTALTATDFSFFVAGITALDLYFGERLDAPLHVVTEADLSAIARVFDRTEYPGSPETDVITFLEDQETHIRIVEDVEERSREAYGPLDLLYDPRREAFLDTFGIYPELRNPSLVPVPGRGNGWRDALDAAVLVSRYPFQWEALEETQAIASSRMPGRAEPEALVLRTALSRILTGATPWRGFDFLAETGYLGYLWPELDALREVDQSKEHHPEGDGWNHTMETLKFRKTRDLTVSLALLFHDVGKPLAEEYDNKKFHLHADLGEEVAVRRLRNLGYPASLIREVAFLIGNHMIPGILTELSPGRLDNILSDPLFPLLLEVYRCDLSSTWRGPEDFYRASRYYRQYLKNRKNPFRNSEGKKRLKTYVGR